MVSWVNGLVGLEELNIASWLNRSMANSMMRVKAIVSIALFLMLAITLLTGLEGGDSEGNGLNDGGIHIASAAALGLLAVVHIMLNGKVLAHQIKTLLGIN
jgi:hypothetical protein